MRVQITDNYRDPLGEFLRSQLKSADEFLVASAFFTSAGFSVVKQDVQRILSDEGRVSIIHGADFRITDPDAIQTLVDMKERYGHMTYRVAPDWRKTDNQTFHPKMYITTADHRNYCAVIGSSNMTLGGLQNNTEVNVILRGRRGERQIENCLVTYRLLSVHPNLVEPDAGFVEKYAELYRYANSQITDAPPSELRGVFKDLFRPAPKTNTRAPKTWADFIALAITRLSKGDEQRYISLPRIYEETERLARRARKNRPATFIHIIRKTIYNNTFGEGENLFEAGVNYSGLYRLSEKGRAHARRLAL